MFFKEKYGLQIRVNFNLLIQCIILENIRRYEKLKIMCLYQEKKCIFQKNVSNVVLLLDMIKKLSM